MLLIHTSWPNACDLACVGLAISVLIGCRCFLSRGPTFFSVIANRMTKIWSEPFFTIGTPTIHSKMKIKIKNIENYQRYTQCY